MDKILELLSKYNCDLIRGDKTTLEFLTENFTNYIVDLKKSIDISDNPLIGESVCKLLEEKIKDIELNCNALLNVLELYFDGNIIAASNKAFGVFERMKPEMMTRYSGAFKHETYFRIRSDISFPLERKEMFHIPTTKRHLVATERYSMPGHPCLYLASGPELCWYECGRPSKFTIAKFDIPQADNYFMKFIDFSEKLIPLSHAFVCWFYNEPEKNKVENYLLKHICTYPLRAACSVKVRNSSANFKEEYIIPQLLLQWVVDDDYFDGIRYESCSSHDDVKALGAHNIVLISRKFDSEGYDINLRKNIGIGIPQRYNVKQLRFKWKMRRFTKVRKRPLKSDPFLWGMESISQDYEKF